MSAPCKIPISIPVPPYLADHRIRGQSVLPAVEALQVLARAVRGKFPKAEVLHSREARFLRFLNLPVAGESVQALALLKPLPVDGEKASIEASLVTEVVSKTGALTRHKEHVSAVFGLSSGRQPDLEPPPMDLLALAEGPALLFPAQAMYQDMVLFGPAFQNVTGRVHLSDEGAQALVRAPAFNTVVDPVSEPLGSPFPMDAGFQLACAWGGYALGITGFPTAYARRRIFRPTQPGETYFCRVFPRGRAEDDRQYDIWLFDESGSIVEAVIGLVLRDFFRGAVKPPDWVRAKTAEPLHSFRSNIRDFCLMELDTVCPFTDLVFSPRERQRTEKFGEKRMKSFTAARIALKQLSRKIGLVPGDVPASELDTQAPDGERPSLAGPGPLCSAAHNDRFAIAVAAETPVGVDVERLSDKAYDGRRYFMSEEEMGLVEAAALSAQAASTRVWTVKEAVAKALNTGLPKAWRLARVIAIGPDESRLTVFGRELTAFHGELEGHVFTLFLADQDLVDRAEAYLADRESSE